MNESNKLKFIRTTVGVVKFWAVYQISSGGNDSTWKFTFSHDATRKQSPEMVGALFRTRNVKLNMCITWCVCVCESECLLYPLLLRAIQVQCRQFRGLLYGTQGRIGSLNSSWDFRAAWTRCRALDNWTAAQMPLNAFSTVLLTVSRAFRYIYIYCVRASLQCITLDARRIFSSR